MQFLFLIYKKIKPFYVLKESGVNKEDIYVTGSHVMDDTIIKDFIQVKDSKMATKQTTQDNSSEWFSCLITSDHFIKIGNIEFWDWEDDDVIEMIQKRDTTTKTNK
jgi:hypothetical protein